MIDWYWGLSGLTWLITTVTMGGATLGLIGLVVIWSAKSIAKSFDHDRKLCPCRECERYRVRQINKAYSVTTSFSHRQTSRWISTAELEKGLVVVAQKNGEVYRVQHIEPRAYGYVLILRNLNTRQPAWLTIQHSSAHKKLWRLADGTAGRIHGL